MVRPPRAATETPLSLTIVPVQTSQQWHDFHHLPFKIYADDPHWVAPLLLERKFHFQPRHNPYFQHARAAFFLAYRDKEPAGRITAQIESPVSVKPLTSALY